jgi:hypothetical protein
MSSGQNMLRNNNTNNNNEQLSLWSRYRKLLAQRLGMGWTAGSFMNVEALSQR